MGAVRLRLPWQKSPGPSERLLTDFNEGDEICQRENGKEVGGWFTVTSVDHTPIWHVIGGAGRRGGGGSATKIFIRH